jgi:EAL and modified HD-GYP domain-containing signal transduction protein
MNTKVLNVIDVINTLHNTTDIKIITEKFSLYPELTFNLLRYINSAQYSFRSEITSIRQIINLLGPIRLRSWLGLFVYSDDNESGLNKETIRSAKFRANMMRELVIAHKKNELSDEAFLTGSLSLIDVYLKINMEELLEKIFVSKPIKEALLAREGYLGKILTITEKIEKTENLEGMMDAVAPKLGITSEELHTLYIKANSFDV